MTNKKYSYYKEPPKNFITPVEASCCVCEYKDTILLLKRHPEKWEGNTWNVPGGKMDIGETPQQTAIRETFEEAGLELTEQTLEYVHTGYIRTEHRDSIIHLFRCRLEILPRILLRPEEAIAYIWAPITEVFQLPLIIGGKELLESLYLTPYKQTD